MACKKPETLRKMVSESQSISPPLLNKDKTSEMDILYNRIDQQVELISVLKQRLDEMTRRWERSEAEHEQQEAERSKIQKAHNQLVDKYATLEVRWKQLSENHKEMILLKDDYKDKCRALNERLKKLESGESAAVATEQRKCAAFQQSIAEMKSAQKKQLSYEIELHEKIKMLECKISSLHEAEQHMLAERMKEKNKMLKSVSELELKLECNSNTIEENNSRNVTLSNQVTELTQQIISRGKLVHEKEDQIKKLEAEKAKNRQQNKKLTSELATLKESINSNRVVRDLREELLDQKESHKRLEMELERFKTAAKEALKAEKAVNEELRHVASGRLPQLNPRDKLYPG